MKRIYIFIIILAVFNAIKAQPAWVKKASKSVFTVKTFSADGNQIGSANGFFVGENGEAVSCFTPFKGAASAIVIDAQGKEMIVDYILGANETYDVVKFHAVAKRTIPLVIAQSPAQEKSTAWLLPYCAKKALTPIKGEITKAELFSDKYTYYTITAEVPENTISCPFLNDNGEVIGLLQTSVKNKGNNCFAVSSAFANDLKISGLSINDAALKSIFIKKELPNDIDQAILTMYIAGATLDSAAYENLVEDFINKFPNAADGYIYRARLHTNANRFDKADEDMLKAIKCADKKDDAHYNYASIIYNKEIYKKDIPYDKWSFDKAAEEAETAYMINPVSTYKQLKAQIRLAQKQYEEAYNEYKTIIDGGTRTAELFFMAAKCKEIMNDSIAMVALLDSAVNTFSRPYLKTAAPYIIARGQALAKVGRYRNAVADFNEYEKLMSNQLNDNFYYIKAQTELDGNMFQQALNDITKAIEMNPEYDIYYAEKASIEVRVGMLDEAISTSKECIRLAPDSSNGYLFLGYALCLKGEKEEGLKNLEKAKELGDEQAQSIMDKYKQ
ncbi:MAG: hypothetical protein ACI4TW_02895 [Prevotella sp.]